MNKNFNLDNKRRLFISIYMILFLLPLSILVGEDASAKTPVLEETNTFVSDNLSLPLPILSSDN